MIREYAVPIILSAPVLYVLVKALCARRARPHYKAMNDLVDEIMRRDGISNEDKEFLRCIMAMATSGFWIVAANILAPFALLFVMHRPEPEVHNGIVRLPDDFIEEAAGGKLSMITRDEADRLADSAMSAAQWSSPFSTLFALAVSVPIVALLYGVRHFSRGFIAMNAEMTEWLLERMTVRRRRHRAA